MRLIPALTVTLTATLDYRVSAVVNPSLTKENYDVITDGKIVFIKFFAAWCGHCKNLKPEWEKLAKEWANNEIGLIAEVNCEEEGKSLCDEQKITGYPTIKYGDPDFLEIYHGAWAHYELSPFAKENLKPICTPKKLDLCDAEKKSQIDSYTAMSSEELDKLIAEKKQLIQEAAEKYEKGQDMLGEIHDKALELKNKKIETIMENGVGLMKSVQEYRGLQPRTLPSLTSENFDSLTDGKLVFLKFFAPWCGHCKAMADDWTKLWKEWDGSETGFVAEVDCTTIENEELCNKFNIKGYPTLLYGNTSSLKKYTGEIFFDELSDFAKQNLKPKEPTAVIDLTPDNYESMTNGKTIFVKFFAPWCGHCKNMAPAWEELAKKWADDDIGLIAEVDCTVEEGMCDDHKIEGYPAVKYGDPAALEIYHGKHDFDSLNKFAEDNLKPICRADNLHLCEGKQKKLIGKFMAMTSEDLEKTITEQEQKSKDIGDKFDTEVKELQNKFDQLLDDKDKQIAFITENSLGMMKKVAEQRGVTPKPVPSLTPDNFDSLTEGKYVFIKYYAPWCGHCKNMAADWTKLYQEWKDNDTGLIAEIDCAGEGEPLCKDIENYPTLFYGEPKALKQYRGGRGFETLSSFAKENLKYVPPPAVHTLTSENYHEKTTAKTVFIKFYVPWCKYCKEMEPDWEKLAQEYANSEYALISEIDCTVERKLCEEHYIEGYPSTRYGDPGDLDFYSGPKLYDHLSKFAKENLKPLCSALNLHRCNETQTELIKKFLHLSEDVIDTLIATQERKLMNANEKFKNGKKDLEDAKDQLEKDKQNKIAFITDQGLGLMMSIYEHRGLAPKPVISLTPENYESMTQGKKVFIKYFAPWCGHCKKMAKDFLKLSQKYENSETILVAEIDCTDKDNGELCKEHGIKGYPTIKFGDPKKSKQYHCDDRTVAAMSKFIEKTLDV